ncbi:MAG: selenocysteine-specific translation elongation factor [Gammaproteobacteria bacterium]|nr:selenocysteine-specific translation elongation factor [Gammaproteobacteria bacterium]
MIIATAGHIDHGKTLLVQALTGVNSDRLPEEKQRGMSIDLGFAYRDFGDGEVLGLVDVPGHERFIRNMLAGVIAVDCALLVVAADDGPMPQTREHLDILDLLGVERGIVALTKIDRVNAARIEQATDDIKVMLAGTSLADAHIEPVCAPTGEGIEALTAKVRAFGKVLRAGQADNNFRLAIDRAFTVPGAGLVVTGHVFSGHVSVDDRLIISPNGGEVRVRGLHADDRMASAAGPGERCALNLAGQSVRRERVKRGQWAVAEPAHAPTQRLDTKLRVLPNETRALRHWTPVHVHLGTQDLTARIATLEGETIEPGEQKLVRLMLDRPAAAWVGDRFIVRDQSAQRTLGGGHVLDPLPPARGRSHSQRIGYLRAVIPSQPANALTRLTAIQPSGVELDPYARGWNLPPEAVARTLEESGLDVLGSAYKRLIMDADHWANIRKAVVNSIGQWLDKHPERTGIERERLRRALPMRVSPALLEAAIAALRASNQITVQGPLLTRPGHRAQLPPADQALWNKIRPYLERATDKPPTLPDLAKSLSLDPMRLRAMAERAVGAGILAHVNANRFFTLPRLRELAHMAEQLANQHSTEGFTAAAFRDVSGIGRNATIELLEYFDRVGLTRRIGNIRRLQQPAQAVIAKHWSE